MAPKVGKRRKEKEKTHHWQVFSCLYLQRANGNGESIRQNMMEKKWKYTVKAEQSERRKKSESMFVPECETSKEAKRAEREESE